MKNIIIILFVLGTPTLLMFNACVPPKNVPHYETFQQISSYNQSLLEILGQGECSVCDTMEILKVMSVAINRTYDTRFPNSLHEVLYADNQFHGMYRFDYDNHGRMYISDKVKWCAAYLMENDSVLPSNVLGFLRVDTIKTKRGKRWYEKIKDRITEHEEYHSFYTM